MQAAGGRKYHGDRWYVQELKTPKEAAEVDGTTMLDGNPVTRHCRVGKDDKMVHGCMQKSRQAQLHQEDHQHDGNANDGVADAHGMPLEGASSICERQSQ